MKNQLLLFENSKLEPLKYNLFLAVFPDDHTAQQIMEFGGILRRVHSFKGRLRPVHHLHVSLFFLGHIAETPKNFALKIGTVIAEAIRTTPPFELRFNRLLSFRGRPGNHPLVLATDDRENSPIKNLHAKLYAAFSKYFPNRFTIPPFVPHLTLLYDRHRLMCC
jgi:RNA 2',3'-cyclic 3'-phosphodiesterase